MEIMEHQTEYILFHGKQIMEESQHIVWQVRFYYDIISQKRMNMPKNIKGKHIKLFNQRGTEHTYYDVYEDNINNEMLGMNP